MISIIVPVYNAKNLEMCVESLIHQSYPSLDILLIDDGSTDDSGAICDAYQDADSRVRAVHQTNAGVSAARNTGLRLATSPYIMFVDSDDSLELTACEDLMREMDREPSDLLIFGYFLHQKTIAQIRPGERRYASKRELCEDFSTLYDSYLIHCVWNKVFVRDRIDREFDVSLSLGEDLIFVLDYMKNAQSIRCLDTCYYHYRWNSPSSLTMRYRDDYFAIGKRLYREASTFCQDYMGENADKTGLCNVFLSDCFRAMQNMIWSSSLPKKEVRHRLREWVSDPDVGYAAVHAALKGREERFLVRAIQRGRVESLYCFYAVKRYIKKIKRGIANE